MYLPLINYGFWEFWAPFDPAEGFYGDQKCIFDGINKLIYIAPSITSISVKQDVYSDWKEWVQTQVNASFLPAFRVSGGDPIGGGEYTGDVYFLINNWRIVIDHQCIIDGVIYSDDYPSPFIQSSNAQLVTNKVSALVQTVTTGSGGSGISAADVWNYYTRTLTSTPTYNGPTTIQIRQEIDNNSTQLSSISASVSAVPTAAENAQAVWEYSLRELSTSMTPDEFWNFLLSTPMASGSAGEKLKQVLTTGNFLALK